MADCPRIDENLQNCTCKSTGCPRRGRCCECIMYHREHGGKPDCMY